MEKIPEIELVAVMFLGYILSWVRAPERVHNYWSWIAAGVAAAGLWWWMTPGALSAFQHDWRRALVAVVMFALAGQGGSRAMTDTKAVPQANSQ